MLHWEGCEVTLLVGTSVCIGWLRSMLQELKSVTGRTQSVRLKKTAPPLQASKKTKQVPFHMKKTRI